MRGLLCFGRVSLSLKETGGEEKQGACVRAGRSVSASYAACDRHLDPTQYETLRRTWVPGPRK